MDASASEFMNDLKEKNYAKALQSFNGEVEDPNGLYSLIKSAADSSEDSKQAKTILDSLVDSYWIMEDSTDNQASFGVYGLDYSSIDLSKIQSGIEKQIDAYFEQNRSRLYTIWKSHSEEEYKQTALEETQKLSSDLFEDVIESSAVSNSKIDLDMENTDGSWKIAAISIRKLEE